MIVYVVIGGFTWEGDDGSTCKVFAKREDADAYGKYMGTPCEDGGLGYSETAVFERTVN